MRQDYAKKIRTRVTIYVSLLLSSVAVHMFAHQTPINKIICSDKVCLDVEHSLLDKINHPPEMFMAPTLTRIGNHYVVALEKGDHGRVGSTHVYSRRTDRADKWVRRASLDCASPQIFKCFSGVYILCTTSRFTLDADLVISKALDSVGGRWTKLYSLTNGWSVHMQNTGIDVSNGKVTAAFEVFPSMRTVVALTRTISAHEVALFHDKLSYTFVWVSVEDASSFSAYTLVTASLREVGGCPSRLYFRVTSVELESRPEKLLLRVEKFNKLLGESCPQVYLPSGTVIEVARTKDIYGATDWLASGMTADQGDDLLLQSAWTFVDHPVGNPASLLSEELDKLFKVQFPADDMIVKGVIGRGLGLNNEELRSYGFGSIYWMEGVLTRVQHINRESDTLLSIMRVNNDVFCDLAAILEFTATEKQLKAKFLRYTSIPGLGIAHPTIVYDEQSKLYWMMSNFNRDSTRAWGDKKKLHRPKYSSCEIDRSTLVLYSSTNLLDWLYIGVVARHMSLDSHFTYPHMVIDGDDLVMVCRSTLKTALTSNFYNNHHSNSVSFLRVKKFRALVNVRWMRQV